MPAADIGKAFDGGGGTTPIATLGGATLNSTHNGEALVMADAAGTKAIVTRADSARSNGVIHNIDAVLLPMR